MPVTIAIPFYNAEKFLADAIRSIFAQTYQDWELILIDDGSTDRSLEIAKSVKDPRVRVFSDGLNKKLASRLNEVTKLARYELIARMDADDLISPDRLSVQYEILKNNSYDITTSGLYSVLDDLTPIGKRGINYSGSIDTSAIVFGKIGILHAGIMARREWYERNQYDESLMVAQDFDLWLHAIHNNDLRIKLIDKPLYIYREESSVSFNKIIKTHKVGPKIITKYIKNPFLKRRIIVKSKTKFLIVNLLNTFGLLPILQMRRNKKISLTKSEVEEYNRLITTIKRTRVPGLVDNN